MPQLLKCFTVGSNLTDNLKFKPSLTEEMRKLAFIDIIDVTRKLIIYHSGDGVFLFGYDCLQDTSSKWDNWFMTVGEAEEYSEEVYKVDVDKWIPILDPLENCQHDFIMPTRIRGREIGKPHYGKFEAYINNKWVETDITNKYYSLNGHDRK